MGNEIIPRMRRLTEKGEDNNGDDDDDDDDDHHHAHGKSITVTGNKRHQDLAVDPSYLEISFIHQDVALHGRRSCHGNLIITKRRNLLH
jgi:hypothetical protein